MAKICFWLIAYLLLSVFSKALVASDVADVRKLEDEGSNDAAEVLEASQCRSIGSCG